MHGPVSRQTGRGMPRFSIAGTPDMAKSSNATHDNDKPDLIQHKNYMSKSSRVVSRYSSHTRKIACRTDDCSYREHLKRK